MPRANRYCKSDRLLDESESELTHLRGEIEIARLERALNEKIKLRRGEAQLFRLALVPLHSGFD